MIKQAVEENVAALSRAILSEARAESDAILAEARQKAEAVTEQARRQAEDVRQQILARAKEEVERLRGQSAATAHMQARKLQLDSREKLLDRVFLEARKELPHVSKWSEYPEIAQNLLREAIQQLHATEVRVRADANTHSILSRKGLHEVAKELNVKIEEGEPLASGTGVIVETPDGRRQYDNTLETRLQRMQNNLRLPVYHQLMGEQV